MLLRRLFLTYRDQEPADGGSNPPADPPADTPADPPADPTPKDPPADPPPSPPVEPPQDPPVDTPPRDWGSFIEGYAKGDEKIAKQLNRYSSMEAAVDALRAAQTKISQGFKRTELKDDATPEELAAWREENGVPQSAEDYELSLPDDYEFDESGELFATEFVEAAHAAGVPPAMADKIFGQILEGQIAREAQLAEQVEADRQVAIEALRQEWGGDYVLNSNVVNNLLATAPEGLSDLIMGGTLADGTPIGHSVEMMRWLANMAREINPLATVVPGSGEQAMASIESELAALEKMMGDKTSEYWKGPTAKKNQQRYEELVDAKNKYAAR